MQKQDIEHNLSLLGEQLEELGIQTTIRLLMIGGGFMLTQIGNRATTDDVDMLVDIDDPMHSGDYRIFRNAVNFVAHDAKLSHAWLSDNIGDFLRIAGPVPRGKLWRRFGRCLDVYVPPQSFILAHKLVAGREKDEEDIRALLERLRITKRAQAQKILDKYIVNRDIQESEEVQRKLNRFFSQE